MEKERVIMATNYLSNDDRWSGFPKLIKLFGFKKGLEVGICEGFHCKHLLKNTELEELWGVDTAPNMGYITHLQSEFPDRFKLLVERSPGCAASFEDGHFDFIHIDAWHTYEACKADLEGWWPKLRDGGVFCGDDFIPARNHPESRFGVDEAVEEFCKNRGLSYFVTGCESEDFNDKLAYATEQWKLLEARLHEGHKTFQIPQWWLIKP